MADSNKIDNFGHRESLEGLPEELLKTLSITKTKQIDQDLIDIIRSFSGIATLDEIVIRRYRRNSGEIPDRQYINNRLLNLVKRKLLVRVPKQKAVYCLPTYKPPVQSSPVQPSAIPASTSQPVVSPQETIEDDGVPF